MAVVSKEDIPRRCVAGAFLVALLHALTVAGETYQQTILSGGSFWNNELRLLLVIYSIFLGPCALVILARKSCLFVKLYAVPVTVLFCMSMYYVAQCWWFGISSMAREKGAVTFWVTLIFGALSAVFAGALLIGLLLGPLRAWFTRQRPTVGSAHPTRRD